VTRDDWLQPLSRIGGQQGAFPFRLLDSYTRKSVQAATCHPVVSVPTTHWKKQHFETELACFLRKDALHRSMFQVTRKAISSSIKTTPCNFLQNSAFKNYFLRHFTSRKCDRSHQRRRTPQSCFVTEVMPGLDRESLDRQHTS